MSAIFLISGLVPKKPKLSSNTLRISSPEEKDLGTFYVELFGYTEEDSVFYFDTLINAFEFFKNKFKPEDKVLIKKLFRRISEERNYKDLIKLIDNSK